MAKDFMFDFNYVYENNKFSKSNKFRTKSSDKSPIKIRLAKVKFWRSKRIEFKSWRKIFRSYRISQKSLIDSRKCLPKEQIPTRTCYSFKRKSDYSKRRNRKNRKANKRLFRHWYLINIVNQTSPTDQCKKFPLGLNFGRTKGEYYVLQCTKS